MKITGIENLQRSLKKFIKSQEEHVAEARKQTVKLLVESLVANIPVWSGRTVESILVNNDGALAGFQGVPGRNAQAEFGQTLFMALGSEPMRAQAEAQAYAQVEAARYDIKRRVYVTIHSEAWGLVEKAAAPFTPGRNKAVVSAVALAQVRAKLRYVR